ncbi:flippase-like domain-containing protein [Dehalococcoidia bacterium]|nr:flippase-like domain-containing protein [Dehalococcoidia bacterium]
MPAKRGILWCLAILVLAAVVLAAGLDKVAAALALFDPLWLLGLSLLQLLTISLTALAWHLVIRAAGGKVGFGETVIIHLTGSFIESVTPSSKLGGEAAKIHLLRRRAGLDYQRVGAVTLVSKLLTLLPFVALTGLCLAWMAVSGEMVLLAVPAFLVLSVFTGALAWICRAQRMSEKAAPAEPAGQGSGAALDIASLLRRAFAFLRQAGRESRNLLSRRRRLAFLALSSIVWILYPVKVLLVTRMLGMEMGLADVAIATYVAYLVSMLPLLPGGLGSFEGTMALLLSSMDVSFSEGLAVALLARLVTFWLPLALSAAAAGLTALDMRRGHPIGTDI